MKVKLLVDTGDGPYEVTTNLWVITLWERKFKRRASEMAEGIGIEDMAFWAYESSKMAGHVVPAVFDDFIKKLESVDVISEEPENPTEAAPTDTL
jgi:hypothetical protein